MYLRKINPFKVGDRVIVEGFSNTNYNDKSGKIEYIKREYCMIVFDKKVIVNGVIRSRLDIPYYNLIHKKSKEDKIVLICKEYRYIHFANNQYYFRKCWLKKEGFTKKDLNLINKEYKNYIKGTDYSPLYYVVSLSKLNEGRSSGKSVLVHQVMAIKLGDKIFHIKTDRKSRIKLDYGVIVLGEVK